MFLSWYSVALLTVEANKVIGLRCRAILQGGPRSIDEIHTMCIEKQQAYGEAYLAALSGASAIAIVQMFRTKVAANHLRLDGLLS